MLLLKRCGLRGVSLATLGDAISAGRAQGLVGITFDRYAWPLVIPLSVLLLTRPPSHQTMGLTAATSAGLAPGARA